MSWGPEARLWGYKLSITKYLDAKLKSMFTVNFEFFCNKTGTTDTGYVVGTNVNIGGMEVLVVLYSSLLHTNLTLLELS